jgi:hypothetical protein
MTMTWVVGGGIVLPAVALSHFLPTSKSIKPNQTNEIQMRMYPVSFVPKRLQCFLPPFFQYIYNHFVYPSSKQYDHPTSSPLPAANQVKSLSRGNNYFIISTSKNKKREWDPQ